MKKKHSLIIVQNCNIVLGLKSMGTRTTTYNTYRLT